MASDNLPKFDNPPVIEVVFGIQFKELKKLSAPYAGLFWEFLGKQEYPSFELRPGLNHLIETYKGNPFVPPSISFDDIPPLPRILFINKEQNNLIQLQSDRLLQNWRKIESGDVYPSFKDLFPKFLTMLKQFNKFLEYEKLGKIEADQYELTYINHIPFSILEDGLASIEKIFPDFKCSEGDTFLPTPGIVSWRKIYNFPENKGHLHVSTKQATKAMSEEILVLELTARGFEPQLEPWFNLAHKWIVKGFEEITSPKLQKEVWRKK